MLVLVAALSGCTTSTLFGRTVTVPILDIPFNSSDNIHESDVDSNRGWYENRAWRK
jgi:hypothetical protein